MKTEARHWSSFKKELEKFPNELKGKLIDYYFNEADKMLKAKLISASHRDDDLAFNAQLASIIRSMNICLFAINDTHFPGDKWNFDSIKQFKIKPSGYGATLRTVLDESKTVSKTNYENMRFWRDY